MSENTTCVWCGDVGLADGDGSYNWSTRLEHADCDHRPRPEIDHLIEEEDFGREDEPDVLGCVLIGERAGSLRARFVVRPGLDEANRREFANWSAQRLQRFVEHGPEPDGWQERSDGDWQMWVRLVPFPTLD